MQVKKTIFYIIQLIICIIPIKAGDVDSKLENSIFISRYIYINEGYSFCLLNEFDIKSSEYIIDFSYKNKFIYAGRVKRLGVWRELYNPLTVSAASTLFSETIGFNTNYVFNKGGLYGLSLELDDGTGISFLLPDDLWIGASYTKTLDLMSLIGFLSVTSSSGNYSDSWTSLYPNIPESDPVHLGANYIFNWSCFTLDYLGSLSGSTIYKTGFYNRLFIELKGDLIDLKGYGGVISPYFIGSNLKRSDTRYLISLNMDLNLHKYWEAVFKTEYRRDHSPVLSVAYIPSSGNSSVKIKYDNSFFNISTKLGQKFNFDFYGTESVENSIEGNLGLSGNSSVFFDYGFFFDFDSILKRKFSLNLKTKIQKTDIELTLKHSEELYDPEDSNTLKLKVDHDFGTGNLYFKIEVGNEWEIEGLTIGFSTEILEL